MVFRDERKQQSATELAGLAVKERHFSSLMNAKIESWHRDTKVSRCTGLLGKAEDLQQTGGEPGKDGVCNEIHPGTLCPVTYVTETILHEVLAGENYTFA